jgi:MFS family permease
MGKTIITISSLLLGIGILLSGNGLQGTLLVLRAVDESFTENTIGIIMSMYFIGFITGTFLCPHIIERVRHIRTFAIMAAICSSSTILMGLWVNPWVWCIMRFVLGICVVGIFMVTESWLNTQAANTNRGRVFSFYILVNLVFLAAGQFLILAADIRTTDLFAIAAALYSLSLVPIALTRIPEPAAIKRVSLDLRGLYRTSSLGFTGSLISGFLNSLFWSLGPLFARLSGLSELGIAIFMSTTILGGILLQFPIGYWSDHTDRRKAIMVISYVSVIISAIAIIVPSTPYYWLAACMFIYGGMMFSIYPVSVAHTNDHPEATDRVAIMTNLLFLYGIGAVFGPFIGGYVIQLFGHTSLFILFILGGTFLGLYAGYWLKRGVIITERDKSHFTPLVRTSQMAIDLQPDDKIK